MKYEKINQYVCQNIAYYVKKFTNGKDDIASAGSKGWVKNSW